MSVAATVIHDEKLGAFTLKFEWNRWNNEQVKAIIALLKLMIPVSDRMYDPVAKEWTISEKYWEYVKTIMVKAEFGVTEEKVTDQEDFFYSNFTDSTPQISKETLATQLVSMLGITPEDLQDAGLLKKAYRRKALELHPDRNNGDGAAMSELNSIWSQYNA